MGLKCNLFIAISFFCSHAMMLNDGTKVLGEKNPSKNVRKCEKIRPVYNKISLASFVLLRSTNHQQVHR